MKKLVGTQQGHTLEMAQTGGSLFLFFDGVRIAERGQPDSASEGKWVALLPGWEINDIAGGEAIEVIRNGITVFGPGSSAVH